MENLYVLHEEKVYVKIRKIYNNVQFGCEVKQNIKELSRLILINDSG